MNPLANHEFSLGHIPREFIFISASNIFTAFYKNNNNEESFSKSLKSFLHCHYGRDSLVAAGWAGTGGVGEIS